jgi:rhamnose utilization protein RhaD (predicted bifunctional aldolase and dehydrogenase)
MAIALLASYGQRTRRVYGLVSNADAAASLMTSSHIDDSEFTALPKLSAALGADPLRTQGAGGNTSVKRDGVMWIKASGTWLADALAQDIMTPVRLDPLRKAIADRDPRAAAATVDSGANLSGLRPSIETSVHAIIPSPVVVHIHCVNTIALAVRADGESLARERLRAHADVALAFVPYRKPGLPLALAIAERLTKGTNVFVLANHGLVVAGQTVAEVADRIRFSEHRLRKCRAISDPRKSRRFAGGCDAGHDWKRLFESCFQRRCAAM